MIEDICIAAAQQILRVALVFFATIAHAENMSCPPMPDDMTKVTKDMSLDIRASAGKLGKLAAAEAALKTDTTAKAIFEKYPNIDKLIILQMFAATYCSALNTSGLQPMERTNQWLQFMERYLELRIPAKPVAMPDKSVRRPPETKKQDKPASFSTCAESSEIITQDKYRCALEIAVKGEAQRAVALFKDLAESGDARAQYQIARAYLIGEGIAQSYTEAFAWFTQAARNGVPAAQHNLGVMYQDGLGISPDQSQAYAWFAEAARAGFSPSRELLTRSGRNW